MVATRAHVVVGLLTDVGVEHGAFRFTLSSGVLLACSDYATDVYELSQ